MLDDLFQKCGRCDGKASLRVDGSSPQDCRTCDGIGHVATEDGKKVLKLVDLRRRKGRLG